MTATCNKCGKNLPLDDFYRRSPRRPGGRAVSYDCKECRRKHRNRRAEYLASQLRRLGGACDYCGLPAADLADGECKKCLLRRGLRKCCSCGETKIVLLDFYSKRSRCKAC